MTRIALASWTPDLFGLANKGQKDAKNVYPTGSGYAPLKDLSAISTTGLDAKATCAIAAQDSSGTINTFAGDASKLYKLVGASFTDVSRSGGYTVPGTERWGLAQFGQRVLATHINDTVQYYDLGSSTEFANLSGSPPQARHIAVVRDFVVLANTDDGPDNLAWSGFNNSAQWTAGSNQSDVQTLQGGGWINGIVGGEVGYIFQERAITRMTYVGPPLIFQFDTVEEGIGLAAPGSLIKVGQKMFFYSQDGFYLKDGDAPSISIGNQAVDSWFADNVQANTFTLISSGVDPANKLVIWSFVSTAATDASHPDMLLIFNWQKGQWSYASIDHELLYPALTEGKTLEQIGALYATLEDIPVSFDSRVWTGGAAYLAAFTTAHQLASFSGDNLAATMGTADFEGSQGRRSIITNVRPLADTSAMTAVCSSRERFADSVTSTSSASMESNGDIPLMSSEGRYHQVVLSVPAAASWTFANGLDIDASDAGEM